MPLRIRRVGHHAAVVVGRAIRPPDLTPLAQRPFRLADGHAGGFLRVRIAGFPGGAYLSSCSHELVDQLLPHLRFEGWIAASP